MRAYCWRSGRIEFGTRVPDGAIQIAFGNAHSLRNLIGGTSRLAYDGKTLLVPGVPEAQDGKAAGDALARYLEWIGKRSIDGVTVLSETCA